jgi:transposase-like protein
VRRSIPSKRRTFTKEFEVEAVKLVTPKGYSFAEAARTLGVTDAVLRKWKAASMPVPKARSPVTATARPNRTNSTDSGPRTRA